ncbi:MAG: ABC transporter permease [Aggregatilineales bacterium]
MNRRTLAFQIGIYALPVILSLVISAILVMLVGRDPLEVAKLIFEGAFRNKRSFAGVLNFFIPLTLVSMGLVVTFRAGLWNIGVEGQMTMGAIFASIIPMYFLQHTNLNPEDYPAILLVLASVFLAMLGGIFWGMVVGFLKIRLGINEIFGGVALNALADVFSIYLISGPWEPDIGGSAQGTDRFLAPTTFSDLSAEYPTSALALGIVVVATIAVIIALRGTRWGLNLKATGKNARSALLLGVATERVSMSAFMVCGGLAGIAGAYRVLFTFDALRPLVSGGIGFLGLLVALLVATQPLIVPIVTFIFAAILSGSTRLRISMQLDSSLASVLQESVVLMMLIFNGVRETYKGRKKDVMADLNAKTQETPVVGESE